MTLPDGVDVTVIEPGDVPGVADEGVALRRGLAPWDVRRWPMLSVRRTP